jgi:hypothetical protein
MIRRIRKVLGLKAESATMWIRNAAFPLDRAIQKISGVKLNPGLIGQDLQHAPTSGLVNFCRLRKFAAAVEHPIVIVTVALLQLIIVIVNSSLTAVGLRKSKGVPATDARSPVGISLSSTGV